MTVLIAEGPTILFEAAKFTFFKQCDKFRCNPHREEQWHEMMRNAKRITQRDFERVADASPILDDDETLDDWVSTSGGTEFKRSTIGDETVYFIQAAGFEFIFTRPRAFESLEENRVSGLIAEGLTTESLDFSFARKYRRAELSSLSDDELDLLRKSHEDSGVRRAAKKEMKVRGVTVAGPGKIDFRHTAKSGKTFIDPQELMAMSTDDADTIKRMSKVLIQRGWRLTTKSESGSTYLTSPKGRTVRISDHPPNGPTKNWIRNNNVIDLRPTDDVSKLFKESLEEECKHGLLFEVIAQGDCYEAAAMALWREATGGGTSPFPDFNKVKSVLVHAEVTGEGPIEGVQYGHAWIERGGYVYDFSNGGNNVMAKSAYYAQGQVVDKPGKLYRYTGPEVKRWMQKLKHYGPWELKTESGL